MRAISLWKVVALAVAAGLILSCSDAAWAARRTRAPSLDCAFHGRLLANGRWCSYQCDRAGTACAQQSCRDGQWIQRLGCVEPFCSSRCS